MPVVRVIIREGQEKRYHEANASIHTPDRGSRRYQRKMFGKEDSDEITVGRQA